MRGSCLTSIRTSTRGDRRAEVCETAALAGMPCEWHIKDNGESWAKAKPHALTAVGRAQTTTEKYLEEEFAMRVASFRGEIRGFFQALDD